MKKPVDKRSGKKIKRANRKEKRLKQARAQRSEVAAAFDRMHDGGKTLREHLEDPTESVLARVDIWDILRRSPHLGRAGAKKILMESKVWPHDKLGDISLYDREELIKALPPRARG